MVNRLQRKYNYSPQAQTEEHKNTFFYKFSGKIEKVENKSTLYVMEDLSGKVSINKHKYKQFIGTRTAKNHERNNDPRLVQST